MPTICDRRARHMPTICDRRARHIRGPAVATALTTLLAATTFATVAFAAHPVKGGTYSGSLLPATKLVTVSFKVSKSGTRVTALLLSNVPLYCSGGGPAIPVKFHAATVSKSGAFSSTATVVIMVGPLKGQVGEKLTITGKFSKAGEHGTVKTRYVKAPSCGGESSYSTTVSG
jgi:hypothetical protein